MSLLRCFSLEQSGGPSFVSSRAENGHDRIRHIEKWVDSEDEGLTHMRIQRVVHVLVEVSYRTATPVLKDVQIGLSLVLREEEREGG